MQGFEQYKFQAETLRILGIALLTPLASAIYQFVLTDLKFNFTIEFVFKAIFVIFLAFFGLWNIYKALDILERYDKGLIK